MTNLTSKPNPESSKAGAHTKGPDEAQIMRRIFTGSSSPAHDLCAEADCGRISYKAASDFYRKHFGLALTEGCAAESAALRGCGGES